MLNFKKLFLGLLFSVLFSAVLIAVCAFMILKLGFLPSEPILGTAAAVIGGVSVFASAFLAARLAGEKGLLHGLVLGTLYAVFYVAISVIKNNFAYLFTITRSKAELYIHKFT